MNTYIVSHGYYYRDNNNNNLYTPKEDLGKKSKHQHYSIRRKTFIIKSVNVLGKLGFQIEKTFLVTTNLYYTISFNL